MVPRGGKQNFNSANTDNFSLCRPNPGTVAPHGGRVGTCPQLLQMAGHAELTKTVLTITKVLTKTTNCTFKAKKVEGHDQRDFGRHCPGIIQYFSSAFKTKYQERCNSVSGSKRGNDVVLIENGTVRCQIRMSAFRASFD